MAADPLVDEVVSVHDRLLQAGLQLARRRARDEVVVTLLGAIGWLERLMKADVEPVRAAARDARDSAIDAAMWLCDAWPREQVAGALLLSMQALDGVRERADKDAALPTRVWNARLAAWQTIGGASPRTHLLDRLLENVREADAPVIEQVVEICRWQEDEPVPDDIERVRLPLELVVRNARDAIVIRAAEFRRVEQTVRWVSGPSGTIGVVGGRPFRVTGPLLYGRRAVRYQWLHEEVLAPFGTLRLRAAAAAGDGAATGENGASAGRGGAAAADGATS